MECHLQYHSDDDGNWFDDAGDTVFTSSQAGNPYLFTGRRLDSLDDGDLDIMYYRNRYYDTETGRFLTEDPLAYVDGMNMYAYVLSNPAKYVDIYGKRAILPTRFSIAPPLGPDIVLPGWSDDTDSFANKKSAWDKLPKTMQGLIECNAKCAFGALGLKKKDFNAFKKKIMNDISKKIIAKGMDKAIGKKLMYQILKDEMKRWKKAMNPWKKVCVMLNFAQLGTCNGICFQSYMGDASGNGEENPNYPKDPWKDAGIKKK